MRMRCRGFREPGRAVDTEEEAVEKLSALSSRNLGLSSLISIQNVVLIW